MRGGSCFRRKEKDMSVKKYEKLISDLVDLVGGNANISQYYHCVTRLRFNVKDRSLVRLDEIKKLPGALDAQWSGEQLQVIIGPNVSEVYDAVAEKNHLEKAESINENLDEALGKTKKKVSFTTVLETISSCITPLIPMFLGIGMLQALLSLISFFGVISAESPTYTILASISDAALYFLPIAVGINSAKKFGASMSMGFLLGGMLLHPALSQSIMEGSASFLGFQLPATYYSYTVFPIIMVMFVESYIEKFLNKHIPLVIRSFTTPLIVLLIMVPLELIVIAPLGVQLGTLLSNFFVWIYEHVGPLAVMLVCATYPLQVLTGMHFAWNPYVINAYATVGYDGLSAPTDPIHNTAEGAACLAIALKEKNKEKKAGALAAASSAIVSGISEPALYGFTFRYRKPLIAVIAGCAVGGLYAGLMHVVKGNYGGSNILGLGVFLNPNPSSFLHIIIAIIIASIVTFGLTWILYNPEEAAKEDTIR